MGYVDTDAVSRWTRASEYLFVHDTGARIERRGFPHPVGWYLVSPDDDQPAVRFEPTPNGCDCAFVAFSGRQKHQALRDAVGQR